jgi:ABC-2 type transport system permease protein
VLDQNRTAVSRRLVSEITASGYFREPQPVASYEEGRERLRRGSALAFLVVPSDFARATERGRPEAQLLIDGADPLSSARVSGIIGAVAREIDIRRVADRGDGPPVEIRSHFRFNATLADHVFFLSVFGGLLLTNLGISLTSLGLVGERESGTYEQMLAQPTRAIEIVLGKLAPNVVLSYAMLLVATILPGIFFDFWPQGSWLALLFVALPYILCSLAIGVLISTIARSSTHAVFMTPFFIMPSFVLSGALMPHQLMPDGVRDVGALFPLRWYQIAARRIIVRGAGLEDVWVPTLALFVMFGVLLAVIASRMKPRLG